MERALSFSGPDVRSDPSAPPCGAGAIPAWLPPEARPGVPDERLGRRPAPHSIWRRMVLAETAQVNVDLAEAGRSGSPYLHVAEYDFKAYMSEAREQVTLAQQAAANTWPQSRLKKCRYVIHELVEIWSGSEHETAMSAVHRAEGLFLMVAPAARLRSEVLNIEAIFKATNDIPVADPRNAAYTRLFARMAEPCCDCQARVAPAVDDRVLLREIRREQNEAWEIARSRVRIFRNILSATIPFLSAVLVFAAVVAWAKPGLLPLRSVNPQASDIAVVEFLGALGGLLSAVATLWATRNYQRFYGLPLAQSILKIPSGAASALAGVLLLQQGLFGTTVATNWQSVLSFALLFGVAQLAVTKQIDARAGDLLGQANAKSPSTAQSGLASRAIGDW